jgi:hypothetical protein
LRVRIIAAKSELTEESLMEHVLNNVPEMYNIEVSKLEDRLGDLSDPLTIEEICAALIRMKKLLCLLEASRASATIAVVIDTSREIVAIRRTTTTTGTTRTTQEMETIKMIRKLSRTSATIARKKDIWQKFASRRSAMKNRRQKGESANAAQDKEDEVGFVMLGLDDPDNINGWYTNHSVIVTNDECENESRFTKNEQQERFSEFIEEYLLLELSRVVTMSHRTLPTVIT